MYLEYFPYATIQKNAIIADEYSDESWRQANIVDMCHTQSST